MRPALILAAVTLTTFAVAQPPAPRAAPKSPPAETAASDAALPWLQRANYLTSAVLDDSHQLDTTHSLLLPARLAELWTKASHDRARDWAAQAADSVIRVPQ